MLLLKNKFYYGYEKMNKNILLGAVLGGALLVSCNAGITANVNLGETQVFGPSVLESESGNAQITYGGVANANCLAMTANGSCSFSLIYVESGSSNSFNGPVMLSMSGSGYSNNADKCPIPSNTKQTCNIQITNTNPSVINGIQQVTIGFNNVFDFTNPAFNVTGETN